MFVILTLPLRSDTCTHVHTCGSLGESIASSFLFVPTLVSRSSVIFSFFFPFHTATRKSHLCCLPRFLPRQQIFPHVNVRDANSALYVEYRLVFRIDEDRGRMREWVKKSDRWTDRFVYSVHACILAAAAGRARG